MRATLDDAKGRLDSGDAEGALRLLLEAWRQTPAPELADVIDLVSPLVTRPSLIAKPLEAQWKGWRAVAEKRDPTDLGRLLAVPLPRKWTEAEPLLRELYDWPADPRLSRFLAQLVLSNGVYARIGENRANQIDGFYHRLLRVLVKLGDVRVLTSLEGVRPAENDVYGRWRGSVGEALEPLAQGERATLSAEERQVVEELAARFASQTSDRRHTTETVERLYEMICERPDDDGLRAVLADLFTERGDVRGEFITLQLQRPREVAKELKLLKKHASAFAGPLDGVFHRDHRVYERGFLAGGALADRGQERFDPKVLDEPSWRLVTTLELPLRFDATALGHPNLAFVRKLEITEADLPPILKREWPFTELIIGHWRDDRLPLPHPLAEASSFPALKVLGVHDIAEASAVACRDWLPTAPVLKRLERVVLDIFPSSFEHWWPSLNRSAIPSVQLGRAPGWIFTFSRDERGELGAVRARHDPHDGIALSGRWKAETIDFRMIALLSSLPPAALTSLIIEPSTTSKKLSRARLEESLKRFTLLARVELPFD